MFDLSNVKIFLSTVLISSKKYVILFIWDVFGIQKTGVLSILEAGWWAPLYEICWVAMNAWDKIAFIKETVWKEVWPSCFVHNKYECKCAENKGIVFLAQFRIEGEKVHVPVLWKRFSVGLSGHIGGWCWECLDICVLCAWLHLSESQTWRVGKAQSRWTAGGRVCLGGNCRTKVSTPSVITTGAWEQSRVTWFHPVSTLLTLMTNF